MDKTASVQTITADFAQELIRNGVRKAAEMDRPMVLSVCDPGGTVKAFLRMDGAPLLSVQLAQDKAYTAAAFGISTDQWHNFIKDDEPLRVGIPSTPRLVTFGGGYPIMVDSNLVGGIGVSGGHYSDDMAVARASLESTGLAVS